MATISTAKPPATEPTVYKGLSAPAENFFVAIIVLVLLSFAVTALRVYSRLREFRRLHLDDWTIMASWVVCLIQGVLASYWCFKGGVGWHVDLVPPKQLIEFFKYFWVLSLTYAITGPLSKTSILLLYIRIFNVPRFHIVAYTVMGLNLAFLASCFCVILFQCTPVRAAWVPTPDAKCLDSQTIFWFSGITNLLLDVLILCLPVPVVWKLQLNKQRKLALTGVFLTGGIVCIASVKRITVLGVIRDSDFTLTINATGIWSVVECNVAIIAACLPTLGSLIRTFRKTPNSSRATPSYNTRLSTLSDRGGARLSVPARASRRIFSPYDTDVDDSDYALGAKMTGWKTAHDAYAEVESFEDGASSGGGATGGRVGFAGALASRVEDEKNIFVTTSVSVERG